QVGYPTAAQKEYPFNLALAAGTISFLPVEDDSDKTQVGPAVHVHAAAETRMTPAKPAADTAAKKSPVAMLAGVAILVLAAAGGGFWYLQRPSAPPQTVAPVVDTPQPAATEAHVAPPPAVETAQPESLPPVSSETTVTTGTENINPATPVVKTEAPKPEQLPPAPTVTTEKPIGQPSSEKPVAEKMVLDKPAKPAPDPKQLALAQALKKAKNCLQNKDYLCVEAESNKALAVDAGNNSAKALLQQAKEAQASAKKSFIIE
ncbi:MAG TPA: hypothetical protein VFM46_07095, partial [Pseudomonadales bacterium]|nr:hypothetical protein [Pseudomonadales bacterium]